jgi:hypothetical protein
LRSALAALIVFTVSAAPYAQRPNISRHTDPVDPNISDAIAALLNANGPLIVMNGETLEFWLVKSLPLKPGSATVDWDQVGDGALVGAVMMTGRCKDAHGMSVKPGAYTLRYEIAPARELLLVPASEDESVAALDHDKALSLARAVTGTPKPAAFVIEPKATGKAGFVLSIPVSRDGADAGSLPFAIVLAGAKD